MYETKLDIQPLRDIAFADINSKLSSVNISWTKFSHGSPPGELRCVIVNGPG